MALPKNKKARLMDKTNRTPPNYRAQAEPDKQAYADVLQQIVGLAKSGAMLGHDHAYDVCLKIEAIATEALRCPTTAPKERCETDRLKGKR